MLTLNARVGHLLLRVNHISFGISLEVLEHLTYQVKVSVIDFRANIIFIPNIIESQK